MSTSSAALWGCEPRTGPAAGGGVGLHTAGMPLPMSSMTTTTKAVGGVAAGAAGFLLLRTLRQRSASDGASPDDNRWRAVTIYRTPEEVTPDGRLPEPLARLGDLVDVEVL